MSYITFASPSGEAELRGPERHHFNYLCQHMVQGFITASTTPRIAELFDGLLYGGHNYHNINGKMEPRWEDVQLWWSVGSDLGSTCLRWRGHDLSPWIITLNTVLRMGSAPMQLAARLHGQCEIHCYVEGPNRAWLADLIASGLKAGVFRNAFGTIHSMGWDDVTALLRARDDEPVVLSYSVTGSFPSELLHQTAVPHNWMEEHHDDEAHGPIEDGECSECHYAYWEERGVADQWMVAMTLLREQNNGTLELKPEHFGRDGDYHFGNGITILDLLSEDRDAIFEEAFGDKV